MVPAALGKKVREIAAKVYISLRLIQLFHRYIGFMVHGTGSMVTDVGVKFAEAQTDTLTSDFYLFSGQS